MHFEISVDIDAAPDAVWRILTDVERWPDMTDSVDRVEILDKPFALSSRARVHQPKLPAAIWTVTDFTENENFTWESRSPASARPPPRRPPHPHRNDHGPPDHRPDRPPGPRHRPRHSPPDPPLRNHGSQRPKSKSRSQTNLNDKTPTTPTGPPPRGLGNLVLARDLTTHQTVPHHRIP